MGLLWLLNASEGTIMTAPPAAMCMQSAKRSVALHDSFVPFL